jgi:hypothetical protein
MNTSRVDASRWQWGTACYAVAAAVQAGRRLLQGGLYRYELTAYCGGSPLQDRIDMVLTDASGTVIWRLQGKCECARQQNTLSLQDVAYLMWDSINQS